MYAPQMLMQWSLEAALNSVVFSQVPLLLSCVHQHYDFFQVYIISRDIFAYVSSLGNRCMRDPIGAIPTLPAECGRATRRIMTTTESNLPRSNGPLKSQTLANKLYHQVRKYLFPEIEDTEFIWYDYLISWKRTPPLCGARSSWSVTFDKTAVRCNAIIQNQENLV